MSVSQSWNGSNRAAGEDGQSATPHEDGLEAGRQADIERRFEIGRLARIESAPVILNPVLTEELGTRFELIGYHHCPSLCQCERAPLYVFGLDTTAYHRGLAANIMSFDPIWHTLDRDGVLEWVSGANPPCPLRIGARDANDDLDGSADAVGLTRGDDDRCGWIVPVYGPYARRGVFLLEYRSSGQPLQPSSRLRMALNNLHDDMSRVIETTDRKAELTQREMDVTRWIVYGKSNPVIAEILNLSTHTVNGYLRRIYLKTGTSDRVSLAIYAINHGVV